MSAPVTARRTSPVAWLLIQPIRFYQRFISRYTPPTCRYYPCCSSYGIGALRTHGALKGLLLTAWRLLRCNPWSSGGVDLVPLRGRWRPAPEEDVAAVERETDLVRFDTDPSDSVQPIAAGAPIAGRTAA